MWKFYEWKKNGRYITENSILKNYRNKSKNVENILTIHVGRGEKSCFEKNTFKVWNAKME